MTAAAPVLSRHPDAQLAERRWAELKTDRTRHEQDWTIIAQLFRPMRKGFGVDDPASAEYAIKPLSSQPMMALNNFAAGLYGTLTNPSTRWGGLSTPDADMNRWHKARAWLDIASDRVLASFAPSVSTFYNTSLQVYTDLAAFGNAPSYDEIDPANRRFIDVALNLAEVVYDIDGHGRVSEVVRKFYLKPVAAVTMFGAGAVPAKLLDMAEKGTQDRVAFYHHVVQNIDFRRGSLGPRGKRWSSRYACDMEHTIVREAGYDEMPFYAPRWDVDAGETYGLGLASNALPAARALQRMDEAVLRAAQRAADPTILAPDRTEWSLNAHVRPGAIVYGGLNMQGNPMLRPLDVTGNIGITLQDRQARAEEIRDAFHYTLMSLAGRTGMTATEVMTINEERMRLWAPYMGRSQEEYSSLKFSRRFSMLWRAGQIPPPPKEMEDLPLLVEYKSAAAMAQKSAEGTAVLRVVEDIAPLAQMIPRLMDRIDPDGYFEALMEARGAPASMARSRDAADAIGEQRAQAEQAAQMMQAAQSGAGVMKDMAGAMGGMGGMGGTEGGPA